MKPTYLYGSINGGRAHAFIYRYHGKPEPLYHHTRSFAGFVFGVFNTQSIPSSYCSGKTYQIGFPLWAAFMLLGSYPALTVWWWAHNPARSWERYDHLPKLARITLTLVVFYVTYWHPGQFVTSVVCHEFWGANYYLDSPLAGSALAWFQTALRVGTGSGFAALANVLLTRRTVPGLSIFCKHCNYNLTGNVSGVCPECGTSISAEAKKP